MASVTYQPMLCRHCKALLRPDPQQSGAATSYATCVYRCEACGVGYSNARDAQQRRELWKDPARNVPAELVSEADPSLDLKGILGEAFNVRARASKAARFGSSRSEDAVTWSVFQFLRLSGGLHQLAALCAQARLTSGDEPSMLLWGSPVAGPLAKSLTAKLAGVCDALKEHPERRSEPDVIVAWAGLLLMIEAKTGSTNEILKGDARKKIDRYTDRPDLFAAPPEAVRALGYFELIRNWRIAADLADTADIPNSTVINLGPMRLRADVLRLRQVLGGVSRRLEHLTWHDILAQTKPTAWFETYLKRPDLLGP